MEHKVHFGLIIKELTMAQKISIEAVANKFGYTRPALVKIFEKEDVSTAILKKACEIFNIDLSYFLAAGTYTYQKGNANIAGDGNVQYKGENNSMNSDNNKMELLLNENQHLKEQNQLLKQMVELLKPKPET